MSIRIDSDQIGAASAGARIDQISKPSDGASKAASLTGAGQDEIEVSPATAKISAEVAAQSSQRAARVQQLGALYASGQYRVDSAQVSRALIGNALSGTL